MKIYINECHQIVGLRSRPEYDTENKLKEIEVADDFLSPYCDTLIKSFCYHEWTGEDGNQMLSVYPFKDFSILESIQEQNDIREVQLTGTSKLNLDLDLRVTMLELAAEGMTLNSES